MFPRWVYSLSEDPRIVESQEALDALGSGWVDSPSALGIVTCPADEPEAAIEPELQTEPEPAGVDTPVATEE